MQQTKKNGALVCMHAENGMTINLIVKQMVAEKKLEPKYHALPVEVEYFDGCRRVRSHGSYSQRLLSLEDLR